MYADKEDIKKEALKRIKALKLIGTVYKEFESDNLVNVSEHNGILFWVNDEIKKIIQEFESKIGGLVYHVIKSNTSIGLMLNLMYVSNHMNEWDIDLIEIMNPVVYIKNMDDDVCSELGRIKIKKINGGLERIS